MYDFFNGFIKRKFVIGLFDYIQTHILKIETDDFYEIMRENIDKFDTTNYITNDVFNIPVTKPMLGKDEFPADIIFSFYGTGAEEYYILSSHSNMKKAKGLKKCVITNQLSGENYQNLVENGGQILRKMNTFKSNQHNIYSGVKNKVAVNHHEDKRYSQHFENPTWGYLDITFYQTDPAVNDKLTWNVVNEFMSGESNHENY